MRKRILCFVVAVLVTCLWELPDLHVFAESSSVKGSDPYIYQYQGKSTAASSHKFTFQWWYKDAAREKVRNRNHGTNIFQISNTLENDAVSSAYCSDFLYSIISEARYKRLNLEDSTYYSEAAAAHIRSILEKGYWYDWTEADLRSAEEAANQWLDSYEPSSFHTDAYLPYDAEEEVGKISGLTADEALMATQLAIWAFANTEGDHWWVKYYESFETEEEGKYDYQELPDNVKAFRKYLIHQQSQPSQPEDILFSDRYFVADAVAFTGSPEDPARYDLVLKIKLAAPVEEKDCLTLTAQTAGEKNVSFPLNGSQALKPDDQGYYSLRLNNLTIADASQITLTISGQQYVDGVYFYEAKPGEDSARETSQNLVGKASGMTPVQASVNLSYEVGTGDVALYKTDGTTDVPLEGAVFNLLAEKDGQNYLVLENLVTDAAGKISVSNLPEGFIYTFVETKAPDGYSFDPQSCSHVAVVGDSITVTNKKLPAEVPEKAEGTKGPSVKASSSPETGDSASILTYGTLLLSAVFVILKMRRKTSA